MYNLQAIEGVNKLCNGCLIGKQKHTPFSSQASYCAGELLELVHGDLCGPIKSATPDSKTMQVLCTDLGGEFSSASFSKYDVVER